MVAAKGSGVAGRAGLLRSVQNYDCLLQKLLSRFSQPAHLVVRVSAETFLTVVACFTGHRHRLFAGCKVDPECFCMKKETGLRRFVKAALDAGTDVGLS